MLFCTKYGVVEIHAVIFSQTQIQSSAKTMTNHLKGLNYLTCSKCQSAYTLQLNKKPRSHITQHHRHNRPEKLCLEYHKFQRFSNSGKMDFEKISYSFENIY